MVARKRRFSRRLASKYPPAKPGALGFEPLKAACRPLTLAPVPHSETHATKEYLTLKVPVRRNALSPTPIERRGQGCRVSFFLPSKSSRVHRLLSEMSNCYCHPGKAGGTPKILAGIQVPAPDMALVPPIIDVFSKTRTLRPPAAALSAADKPAEPDPTMSTSRSTRVSSAILLTLDSRLSWSTVSGF